MSRIVGQSRRRESVGTHVKPSEAIVFVAIAIALIVAARWYFVVYRNSAGVALGSYIGAIKAGDAARQYEMIDDADKQDYPTAKDYEKAPQSNGYTERITGTDIAPEVPDPKDPDVVTVQATIHVRGASQGKELYQTGEAQSAVDTYTLRKDKEGHWKVWLAKSPMTNLLKITPNPPGSSF